MRILRLGTAILLACGLFIAFSDGGQVSLIRIAKNQPLVWTVLQRSQIDVRQELDSCYLALGDRQDIEILRDNRILVSVLDRNADKKDYFIVPLAAPDTLGVLQSRGQAIGVEPGTAVFWVDEGPSCLAIPASLSRKSFSPQSILRWLRAPGIPRPREYVPPFSTDPFIKTLTARVSRGALSSAVQSLQNFRTRYASTPNCEAAGQFLFSTFSTLGLDDVRFETFSFGGGYTSRNVIAEKRGVSSPEDLLIICAHYDSISSAATRETQAPGADDNASGTAAVLEAARILAPIPLDFTVRFIAFSAEEWGLYGSRAHAVQARADDERIIGVINLDMIAYADTAPEDLEVIGNGPSEWMTDRFVAAAVGYGDISANKIISASIVGSDHASFWDQGYPALLGIEDMPLTNPFYHLTSDTVNTLDLDFFVGASRASLGLLTELAQPVRAGYPKTPAGLNATQALYGSLFNTVKNVRLTWIGQTDATGYNVYRTNVSHVDYEKITASPLSATTFTDRALRTDVPYYYVVTAVGGTGLESNFSREVEVTAEISTGTSGTYGLNLLSGAGER